MKTLKKGIGLIKVKWIKVNNIKLVFDEKVRNQCRSCKRYGKKATCPPYIRGGLPQYKHGLIAYKKFKIYDRAEWKEIGLDSSQEIHQALSKRRMELFNEGHYFVAAYGAGSCKLCKECSIPCRWPAKSMIPVEATGVNVVKLMKRYAGIDIIFPVKKYFYRVGLILYD